MAVVSESSNAQRLNTCEKKNPDYRINIRDMVSVRDTAAILGDENGHIGITMPCPTRMNVKRAKAGYRILFDVKTLNIFDDNGRCAPSAITDARTPVTSACMFENTEQRH